MSSLPTTNRSAVADDAQAVARVGGAVVKPFTAQVREYLGFESPRPPPGRMTSTKRHLLRNRSVCECGRAQIVGVAAALALPTPNVCRKRPYGRTEASHEAKPVNLREDARPHGARDDERRQSRLPETEAKDTGASSVLEGRIVGAEGHEGDGTRRRRRISTRDSERKETDSK